MTDQTQIETRREALFRKIRALLAKTTVAGCTEAEAMAAASLARRLMDDYNIETADLHEAEEPFADEGFDIHATTGRKRGRARTPEWSLRYQIAVVLARYSDTRCYVGADSRLHFFGRESDVLFAGWLLETIDAFGLRSWSLFEAAQSFAATPDTDLPDRTSFLHGFADRIMARMREEIDLRSTGTSTGTALVVSRNALVDEEYRRRFPSLGKGRSQTGRIADAASLAAGTRAGNNIGFHRPVAGQANGPLMVGGR